MKQVWMIFCVMALLIIAGCDGQQSAFTALGPVSSRITLLTWIMFIGAALITLLICALMVDFNSRSCRLASQTYQ